jgi:hypothetical protein
MDGEVDDGVDGKVNECRRWKIAGLAVGIKSALTGAYLVLAARWADSPNALPGAPRRPADAE